MQGVSSIEPYRIELGSALLVTLNTGLSGGATTAVEPHPAPEKGVA